MVVCSTLQSVLGATFAVLIVMMIFFYREGSSNINSKGNSWRKIDGRLKCIAVGGHGQVWGVNSADQIWFRPGVNGDWQQIEGALSFITVAPNGLAFGCNKSGSIFFRQGSVNY